MKSNHRACYAARTVTDKRSLESLALLRDAPSIVARMIQLGFASHAGRGRVFETKSHKVTK